MSFRRDLETWTANQVAVRALSDQAKAIRRLLRGDDVGVLGPVDSQGLPSEIRTSYPPTLEQMQVACRSFGFAYNGGGRFLLLDGTTESPSPALLAGDRDWLSLDGSVHISWDGGSVGRHGVYPSLALNNYFLYCNGDYIRDGSNTPIEAPGRIAGAAYSKAHQALLVTLHEDKGAAGQSLLVYKVPATIDDCTIHASAPFELIADLYWITTSAQFCKGPTFFNASATKFAFTTMTDDYWNRDLWEGEITYNSASAQIDVDLQLKFAHTSLGTVVQTMEQDTVTYDQWCLDDNNQTTIKTLHETYTETVKYAPNTPSGDGRYYYCCDYKQDELVYATLEQDKPTYSDGIGYSSVTDFDFPSDFGTGSAWRVSALNGGVSQVKRSLVFHGVNIPDVQCGGLVEEYGGDSITSEYDEHGIITCNIVNTRVKEYIHGSQLWAIDLRADVLFLLTDRTRNVPSSDSSTSDNTYFWSAVISTPTGTRIEKLYEEFGYGLNFPCPRRIDYFTSAPEAGECIYRDSSLNGEAPIGTVVFDTHQSKGPLAESSSFSRDVASHYLSNSVVLNVKVGTWGDFVEIILSGVEMPVVDNMDGVRAVGSAQ